MARDAHEAVTVRPALAEPTRLRQGDHAGPVSSGGRPMPGPSTSDSRDLREGPPPAPDRCG
ncbi:hypothetical protein ASD48_17985 [Streptomyces sp. Root1310]|nr:hypothetical protein ASD48_17985 [Streptomyces sp. Root1310]